MLFRGANENPEHLECSLMLCVNILEHRSWLGRAGGVCSYCAKAEHVNHDQTWINPLTSWDFTYYEMIQYLSNSDITLVHRYTTPSNLLHLHGPFKKPLWTHFLFKGTKWTLWYTLSPSTVVLRHVLGYRDKNTPIRRARSLIQLCQNNERGAQLGKTPQMDRKAAAWICRPPTTTLKWTVWGRSLLRFE